MNALAASIHAKVTALNEAITLANTSGLDVEVDVSTLRSFGKRPLPTLKAHVSLPLTGESN